MKRLDFLTNISVNAVSFIVNATYDLKFQNESRLWPYSQEGFVLLPKHQSNWDIPLEGVLLKKAIGRYGNYVMKDSLPKVLEYLGGMSVMRVRDIRKYSGYNDKQGRAEILMIAKDKREELENRMVELLDKNEIVVSHIEGKRFYQQKTKINPSNLQRFLDIQKKLQKQITFIPLDIKYEDIRAVGSKVLLKVGSPIKVKDDGLEELVGHMANEIELLER